MMLTRDRIVPLGDVIWGSLWDALDGQTFPSTFALARRIGRFYGYNSPDPTHPGMESDGVARRITDAIAGIVLNSLRHDLEVRDKHHTFAEFVPSGEGRHAPLSDLLRVALRAAGIVVLSVEEVNAP